jgi:hypothetical protein
MILDSPFSSLEAVIAETAASGKQKLSESGIAPGIKLMPDLLIPVAVAAIRRSILSRAAFDIRNVNPLARCGGTLIPAVFGHGEDDDMVAPYHSQRLHAAYGGNTTLLRFAGTHNSERGDTFVGTATAFLAALLRPTDEAHPAEGLLYAQPSALRGLLGRPALAESCRFTAGRGFQSAGAGAGGERCSHRGRTAGNLAQLVRLCCLCNPAIRPAPRPLARRYRLFTAPELSAAAVKTHSDDGGCSGPYLDSPDPPTPDDAASAVGNDGSKYDKGGVVCEADSGAGEAGQPAAMAGDQGCKSGRGDAEQRDGVEGGGDSQTRRDGVAEES